VSPPVAAPVRPRDHPNRRSRADAQLVDRPLSGHRRRIVIPCRALFFHEERIADKRGQVLHDDSAARREAEKIAAALERHRGHGNWRVIVTNKWGHDVTEILPALAAQGIGSGRQAAAISSAVLKNNLQMVRERPDQHNDRGEHQCRPYRKNSLL
jgi:hypothetical protein